MVTKAGFADESVAYALAAGFVTFDDSVSAERDAERARRRMKRERRRR